MMKKSLLFLIFPVSMLISTMVNAGSIYQQPADFIKQIFDDHPPQPRVLWLNAELKKNIATIPGHQYKGLRIRYWQQKKRTLWILEAIGKDKPITTGIVINHGHIEQLKILVYRESRGWEVHYDFFTNQFKRAALEKNGQLDTTIDNISGATLSVRAISKLARVALLLDQFIQQKK